MYIRICRAIPVHRKTTNYDCTDPCSYLFLSIKPTPKYLYFSPWLLSYYINTTVYTEDTRDIRHHKETRNSYKYDLQAPPSIRHIRNKNTKSTPSSIYHNLWLKTIYIYTFFLILTQSKISVISLCINCNFNFISYLHTSLLHHRQYNSRF